MLNRFDWLWHFQKWHNVYQRKKVNKILTWGGVGAVLLASAVACFKVLETGCKGAAEDLVAVMLVFGLVGATGMGGRGAVYASFLTTLVIGVDIENVEPIGPACRKCNRGSI